MRYKVRDLIEKVTDRRRTIGSLLAAFLGTYGCLYLLDQAGMEHGLFSVLALPVLLTILFLLERTRENLSRLTDIKQRKRRIRYAAIVAYFFSLTMIMGYQLQVNGRLDYGVKGKSLILLRALFLCIAVFPFGNMLFNGIERIGLADMKVGVKKPWKCGAIMGICAVTIFVCLIPVWLAYYPIVMSYDFHRQANEAAKGFIWFNPYQPLIHTWIIWCFLQLGYLLGDLAAGFAGMALLHMLVYSLVTAYACVFLYRITKSKWAVVAVALFFGLFPLNTVLVVCTTKDVLFGILVLLFCLLLAEYCFFSSGKKRILLGVLLVAEGCVMAQFRNNCVYALVAFGVLWVFLATKKEKLRVLFLGLLLVGGSVLLYLGIKTSLGTVLQVPRVEMCSVPASQFARVGYMYGGTEVLNEETRDLLDKYISEDKWDGYSPAIADAAKAGINFAEAWEGKTAQLLKDWFTIGIQFPNEYIDAFLELTRGYWFLDDRSYAECLGWGLEGRRGVIYTYTSSEIVNLGEIEHVSKFPWLEEQLEKVVSGNAFYKWPVVSLLFKSSFYFWGLCLVFIANIYLRRKGQIVLCMFPLMYMATLLLGPVVWIRYIFPVVLTLPALISLLFFKNDMLLGTES